jgi:hypothetical protein
MKKASGIARNFKFLINDAFVCDKATKIAAMLREIINGALSITK